MKRVNVANNVITAFDEMFDAVMRHTHTEFWLKGGRASTKSSFISLCVVLLVVANPDVNAVVCRRFSTQIKDSVFAQLTWAVELLGLSPYFEVKKSPYELIYKPTGQRILFRHLEDNGKLKGVTFTRGYAAVVWFEELDQFPNWDAVHSAILTLRRGGERFWTFYSYNPPKNLWSWVNKKALEMETRSDVFMSHSTYLDIAEEHPDWLGQPFIDEANYIKATNEAAYRWEYLGEIVGNDGNVFENITSRTITDEELARFDNWRNGIDWGWFPDPWRFVRCHWQPNERRLFIVREESANKKLPSETAEIVRDILTYPDHEGAKPYLHDEVLWCDDTADGKQQMAVYRRQFGLNARPARKGNMRRLSYEWLAGLREIVIDPLRCPLTHEEFALKEYERARSGEWIDDIPDGADHSIDAVRYAMMSEVLRGR